MCYAIATRGFAGIYVGSTLTGGGVQSLVFYCAVLFKDLNNKGLGTFLLCKLINFLSKYNDGRRTKVCGSQRFSNYLA